MEGSNPLCHFTHRNCFQAELESSSDGSSAAQEGDPAAAASLAIPQDKDPTQEDIIGRAGSSMGLLSTMQRDPTGQPLSTLEEEAGSSQLGEVLLPYYLPEFSAISRGYGACLEA